MAVNARNLFLCMICLAIADMNTETSIRCEEFKIPYMSRCCAIRNESIYGIRNLALYHNTKINKDLTYSLSANFSAPLEYVHGYSIVGVFYRVFQYTGEFNMGDEVIKEGIIDINGTQGNYSFIIESLKKSAKYFIIIYVDHWNNVNGYDRVRGEFSVRLIFKYNESLENKIDVYAFAPKISSALLCLNDKQFGILVSWSLSNLDRDLFQNIQGFRIKLSPTLPDMIKPKIQFVNYENLATYNTYFDNVEPNLEYQIIIIIQFKDENQQIPHKRDVTNKAFIIVPAIPQS
ncbi:unnamed protein product [Gordionus sp. m RMFG-2023]